MWRGYVLSGVLALASGVLFRLAGGLDLPLLTMLGFWALVAAGFNAARVMALEQAAAAFARSLAALAVLGPRFEVAGPGPSGTVGFGREPIVVAAPARLFVLVPDLTPDYGRGPLARRRLSIGADRAERLAMALRSGLGRYGYEVDVRPVLLLLRRRLRSQAPGPRAGRVDVINPEDIERYFRDWLAPEKLDPEVRRELARLSVKLLPRRRVPVL